MALQEADFDHREFTNPSRDADSSLAVRFYMTPLQDDAESDKQGRPIFVDTEMIEIRVRGDRNNIIQRPIRPEDKKRFRDAYRDFKDDKPESLKGTPLKEWPHMSASMVEELKYLGFFTVEQLAEANDSACSKMPGLTTMKQRAQAFLEFAKGTAPLDKMSRELEETKARAEAAERGQADMSHRLQAMQDQMNQMMLQMSQGKPAEKSVADETPNSSVARTRTAR